MGERLVFCQKLQKHLPGLKHKPYGEMGEKIYQEISAEAWSLWLGHQTKLINEHRFNLNNVEAKKFLYQSMCHFLFTKK